MNVIKP